MPGYKDPPIEHRFQKGQSGNPKGRPKGSRSLPEIIRKELERPVSIKWNGRNETVPATQALIRRAVSDAIAGKKSPEFALKLAREFLVENDGLEEYDLSSLTTEEAKTLLDLLERSGAVLK